MIIPAEPNATTKTIPIIMKNFHFRQNITCYTCSAPF